MARIRTAGVNRAGLSYLGVLAGLGDGEPSLPSVTGVDSIDRAIYSIRSKLDDFETAMTITTISSLAGALCGVFLLFRTARK